MVSSIGPTPQPSDYTPAQIRDRVTAAQAKVAALFDAARAQLDATLDAARTQADATLAAACAQADATLAAARAKADALLSDARTQSAVFMADALSPPPPPTPLAPRRPLLGLCIQGSVAPFEAKINRHVEVDHNYYQYGESVAAAAQIADDKANARRPLISFKVKDGTAGWARIAANGVGADAAYLNAWAAVLKAAGVAVDVIINHEPENDGGNAADFRDMIHAVVTYLRGLTAGFPIRYGLCLMAITAAVGKSDDWYDDVVDFVAWDGYSWPGGKGAPSDGRTLAGIFTKPLAASHGKPVIIAETGCADPARQAAFLADGVAWARGTAIQAICPFSNGQFALSPTAVSAYAAEMAKA